MKYTESKNFIVLAALGLSLGSVLAATTISIPDVEFGAGVASKPDCLSSSIVDYTTSISGTLTEISITGIGNDCAGQWIRISLYSTSDGTGSPVEQVVWRMPAASSPPVASYTARANGSTTGVVSGVVWPTSETGAAGLSSSAISVSSVNSFLLETSDSALTDG
jgi:hypothetical protein